MAKPKETHVPPTAQDAKDAAKEIKAGKKAAEVLAKIIKEKTKGWSIAVLAIAAAAVILTGQAEPAEAKAKYPKRCPITLTAAQRRAGCTLWTWTETRNSGSVRFRAYVYNWSIK